MKAYSVILLLIDSTLLGSADARGDFSAVLSSALFDMHLSPTWEALSNKAMSEVQLAIKTTLMLSISDTSTFASISDIAIMPFEGQLENDVEPSQTVLSFAAFIYAS